MVARNDSLLFAGEFFHSRLSCGMGREAKTSLFLFVKEAIDFYRIITSSYHTDGNYNEYMNPNAL